MDRRLLLTAAAAALACPRWVAAADVAPRLRLSCNLYTFNDLLKSGGLSLEAVIELCAKLGFDAVDPTGYYFPNYPAVPDDAFIYKIRRRAFLLGLDISGTGVRNDFTVAAAEQRAADVGLIGRWVDVAAKLGAPNLRVFSGKGVPAGRTRVEATAWVVDGLRESARLGAARGVMIALQNHNDFLKSADDVLDVIRRVGSDWLGVNLDIGSFPGADPYADIERVVPHAITWQIKDHVLISGKPVKTDLKRIARIVKAAKYRGYLPVEILGSADPRERLPRFLDEMRAAFA
jgi:sugar phosphate isomerase/epimerase